MPDPAIEDREPVRSDSRRTAIVLLAMGALLLLVAVGSAISAIASISTNTAAVEHTLEVEAAINSLSAEGERIEAGRRGFLIQPDPAFSGVLENSNARFDTTLAKLARLISDNSRQVRRVAELRAIDRERDAIIAAMLASPASTVASLRNTPFGSERGVQLVRTLRTNLAQMLAEEQRLLALRGANQQASLLRFYLIGGIALALLVVMMVAAIIVVMRYNAQLNVAQARLRLVNEGLEVAVAARTSELSRANEEIQRFAYIVSHDLRSPLVNVLGFTSELDEARKTLHRHLTALYEAQPELRDEAAWLAVDEDLPEALGFIRTSTEKMDRLINSILELSRQGRRILAPERLDMTALVEGVAATMHQRAEVAGATVTVGSLPELESDRIAVEQILANLVENALKYLSPGRSGVISVEGQRKGRNIEVSVIDNGRGIAPADQERIFELFRRAGTQDQPGEGIGLANVRALAYRLGGRIAVESELNKGSRFTLILPEKFIAEASS